MFMDVPVWGGGGGTTDERMKKKHWKEGHEKEKEDEQRTAEEHENKKGTSQQTRSKLKYTYKKSNRISFTHSHTSCIIIFTSLYEHWELFSCLAALQCIMLVDMLPCVAEHVYTLSNILLCHSIHTATQRKYICPYKYMHDRDSL